MKFRSDQHRKAVFANMFGGSKSKLSRVGSGNVKNLEVKTKTKSVKPQRVKSIRYRRENIKLKEIRKSKEVSTACKLCKRKGLKLSKKTQQCEICEQEFKDYVPPPETTKSVVEVIHEGEEDDYWDADDYDDYDEDAEDEDDYWDEE